MQFSSGAIIIQKLNFVTNIETSQFPQVVYSKILAKHMPISTKNGIRYT